MSSAGFPYFVPPQEPNIEAMRRNRGWFYLLGIALVLVGAMAISAPWIATFAVIEVVGVVLLVGGVMTLAGVFFGRHWRGVFLQVCMALLYIFIGYVLFENPLAGALGYTLVLAMFFIAGGVLRIVAGISNRFAGWGWTVFSGLITLALGIMIWRRFPQDALWVIGLFFGIDLIMNGWSWIMLGLALRLSPRQQA